MPAAASPCQHCRRRSRPLRAVHPRGWHNEPCPRLNLPLPLPAVSVLPAGLFNFIFFPFPASILERFPAGAGTQPLLDLSSQADCGKPPVVSPSGSCVGHTEEMRVALCGRTWSPPVPTPVPRLWWSSQNQRAEHVGVGREGNKGNAAVFLGGPPAGRPALLRSPKGIGQPWGPICTWEACADVWLGSISASSSCFGACSDFLSRRVLWHLVFSPAAGSKLVFNHGCSQQGWVMAGGG